jgi:hypothetical protein
MAGIKTKRVAILVVGILYLLVVVVSINQGLGVFPSLFYSVFLVLGLGLFGTILLSILWGLLLLVLALLEPVYDWLKGGSNR